MKKIIAAINMTIDGFCDHTAVDPDVEIHDHYTELLRGADTLLYGRITYQLMEYWRPFVENPSGEKINGRLCHSNEQHTENCFLAYAKKCRLEKRKIGNQKS